ncbi:TlpA family protein disulfide reductase [Micromonospora sp. NBC_00421]|uniref:TlpA family protein disulfide reductase n=1 Tax=Micromonospora sp. NBC_00421 TaxID=2975976 RepID=UPI002E210D73
MLLLAAAVTIVGVLVAVNLLLCLGIVRRVREHATRLAALPELPADGMLPVGAPVGSFTAHAVDGTPVTRESLPDGGLCVFLAADCPPCRDELPDVVEAAAAGRRVVAVVVGDDGAEPMVSSPAATLPGRPDEFVDLAPARGGAGRGHDRGAGRGTDRRTRHPS